MNAIDDIIELSISDENRKEKWTLSVRHYSKAIKICRKKVGDYTEEKIALFDDEIKIFPNMGQFDLLGSGHILIYMVEWGNLNCYSHQGWDALMALIKKIF